MSHQAIYIDPRGRLTYLSKSQHQIRDFDDWLGEQPHRHKVVIPGNHEYAFEENPRLGREISNAIFLIDEAIEAGGFRIWGSPLTNLYRGAFGRSAAADRARVYAGIPQGTDILVTHGPPFGVLDRPVGKERGNGCQDLRSAVNRIRPRLHVFGHIHGGYGMCTTNGTIFVNAALVGESLEIEQRPIVVELEAGIR